MLDVVGLLFFLPLLVHVVNLAGDISILFQVKCSPNLTATNFPSLSLQVQMIMPKICYLFFFSNSSGIPGIFNYVTANLRCFHVLQQLMAVIMSESPLIQVKESFSIFESCLQFLCELGYSAQVNMPLASLGMHSLQNLFSVSIALLFPLLFHSYNPELTLFHIWHSATLASLQENWKNWKWEKKLENNIMREREKWAEWCERKENCKSKMQRWLKREWTTDNEKVFTSKMA